MSTTRLPTLSLLRSGWPHAVLETWNDKGEVPHPSGLFTETASSTSPIGWSSIEEVESFIAYVMGRDDLVQRLAPTRESVGLPESDDAGSPSGWSADEILERFTRYNAVFMITGLLDRVRALQVTSLEELTELYEAYERGWLAPTLPVEYVVPLVLTAFDDDVGDESDVWLSDTVRIERLDAPTQQAAALAVRHVSAVPQPLLTAATHALVVIGEDIANSGPGTLDGTPDRYPIEAIEAACSALQVSAPIRVGYATVLRRPLGWARGWTHDLPPLDEVATVRQYWPQHERGGWNRSPGRALGEADLAHARRVLAVLEAPDRSTGRLRIAASRLSMANRRTTEHDRVLDACVGLEALLGDGRTELTHRMSLRAATALATRQVRPLDPEFVYTTASKVYAYRSLIVHGSTDVKPKHRTLDLPDGSKGNTAHMAVELLRGLLMYAIDEPGEWSPALLDDVLFARLRSTE